MLIEFAVFHDFSSCPIIKWGRTGAGHLAPCTVVKVEGTLHVSGAVGQAARDPLAPPLSKNPPGECRSIILISACSECPLFMVQKEMVLDHQGRYYLEITHGTSLIKQGRLS